MHSLVNRWGETILAAALGAIFVACSGGPDVSEALDEGAAEGEPVLIGELEQALSCQLFQEDRVGNGFWMSSSVDYDDASGSVSVSTTLSNSRSFVGFTGGVAIAFVDANQQELYRTPVQQFGLDGCRFRCPRTRSADWQDSVPVGGVAGIAILQAHTPTGRALPEHLRPTAPPESLMPDVAALVQPCF
jgi:hypothetical protein